MTWLGDWTICWACWGCGACCKGCGCCGCCCWICAGTVVVVPPDTSVADAVDVFGDGCGTAAGAGLADEFDGWGLGDTILPGFNAFLPRKLCKSNRKKNETNMNTMSKSTENWIKLQRQKKYKYLEKKKYNLLEMRRVKWDKRRMVDRDEEKFKYTTLHKRNYKFQFEINKYT